MKIIFTMVSGKEYIKNVTPAMAVRSGISYEQAVREAKELGINLPMAAHVIIEPDPRDALNRDPVFLNPLNIESMVITDIISN